MRNKKKKKKTLEEYYRIKVDIECVFFFLLNSKEKYYLSKKEKKKKRNTYSKHSQSITSFIKLRNLQCSTLISKL